jgi:hypothetical protein
MDEEKGLATDQTRDDPQTQPLTPEQLQKENAETSLDQPSEGSE